jgi:hypothetical protein
MKINDLVIVSSLGEMKIYKANPRDLEAEAGLKPQNIKLDLPNAFDYIEAHMKMQDINSDEPGQFKGANSTMRSSGEDHNLKEKIEEDIIKAIAEDINTIVEQNNPPRVFLAVAEPIFNRVEARLKSSVKNRIFKSLKKDLTKTDKNRLVGEF